MPLNYEHECPLGHQVFEDDLTWCTTCEMQVWDITQEQHDPTGDGPFPQDACWNAERLDGRNKDLLYGRNDDTPHDRSRA